MLQFLRDLPTYFDFLIWTIRRKQWIGRHYVVFGRARKVIAEAYDNVTLDGLPGKISKSQLSTQKFYLKNEHENPYRRK